MTLVSTRLSDQQEVGCGAEQYVVSDMFSMPDTVPGSVLWLLNLSSDISTFLRSSWHAQTLSCDGVCLASPAGRWSLNSD